MKTAWLTLDELDLLFHGYSTGKEYDEKEIQADDETMPPLQTLAPIPPKPSSKKVVFVLPESELPQKGERIEVLWADATGDAWRWHKGQIADVRRGCRSALWREAASRSC